ncbi:hypothetical protein ACP275_13G031000 [Erythranthe tilingii]
MPYDDDDYESGRAIDCGDICCTSVCELTVRCLLVIPVLFICFCLSFQNHKPLCHVVDFYAPALDTFSINNSNNYYYNINNTFVFFDLKLENVMPFNGLLYEDLNLTFSYGDPPGKKIGSLGLPGFYQGMRKTAHQRDVANTCGVPWADAFASVSKSSVVVFRVDLETEVRSKCYFWYMKKQRVVVGGDVRIGNTGVQVGDMAVLLKSAAARVGGFQESVWVLVLVAFSFFLHFFCFLFIVIKIMFINKHIVI